jgi:hypothetical protein
MAKNFEKLIFGGLHEKHAVQRGIWVAAVSRYIDSAQTAQRTQFFCTVPALLSGYSRKYYSSAISLLFV